MTGTSSTTDKAVRPVTNGVEVSVLVLPRSSRNSVVGFQDTSLKIKISKPPVDGQANTACCRLLADFFGVSPSMVTVVRGHTSRRKILRIEGLSCTAVQETLRVHDL